MANKFMLQWAKENGFAIPAFNYSDIWELLAIIDAAKKAKSPVYIASNMRVVDAMGIEVTGAVGRQFQEASNNMICNHLDHSTDVDLCLKAIDNHYGSVMYDGSLLDLKENVSNTTRVVKYAHARGVFVEAEVGKIRGNNVEGVYVGQNYLATKEEALAMQEAGIDSLAIGIGNAHGFYKETPVLNLERLHEINKAVDIPLVLHGGTGIPSEQVTEAIRLGIAKVNVGTLLHSTYINKLKEKLNQGFEGCCIPDLFEEVKEAISNQALAWIRICMANDKLNS